MFWILVSLIAMVAAGYFFKCKKHADKASPASPESGLTQKKPIWGKRIVVPTHGTPCMAARASLGQSFELDKLPVLPLAACTCKPSCLCHFESVTEKRDNTERRSGNERRPALRFDPKASQRRSGHDRRKKNQDPFSSAL